MCKVKCNLCGSDDNKIIAQHTRFEKNDILECQDCGLVYLKSRKDQESIEKFYQKEYREVPTIRPQTADEMFNNPILQHDCVERIEWIKGLYGSLAGKKVLDIGSCSGYFLDKLSSDGAEVVGVELNKEHRDYARDLGFTVYSEPVENLGFDNEFDLIVMFHTLEHVCDPRSVIRAVYSALVEGGLFVGEVPNQYDWRLKIFDNEVVKRFHYDPNHYYYFSPDTVKKYLSKCGFKAIQLETVERYNSLVQLRRILCGEYNPDKDNINEVLARDIFAQPADDVRLHHVDQHQETVFNELYGNSVNDQLMGNCLRWVARK